MNKNNSSRFLYFIGAVGFLLFNLACNQLVGKSVIDNKCIDKLSEVDE